MTEGPEDRSFVSAFDADQRDKPRNSARQSSLLGHFGHDIDIFIRAGRLFSDSAIGPGAYQHAPFPQFLNQLAPLPSLAGLSSAHGTAGAMTGGRECQSFALACARQNVRLGPHRPANQYGLPGALQ